MAFEHVRGNCPECGKLFESYGTATLSLTIGAHLQRDHDYPTRFWAPNAAFGPSKYPAPGTAAAVPFDEAFYDGARLTPFDRGNVLAPMRVCWLAPRGWPPCERP